MPSTAPARLPNIDLKRSFGSEGEEQYRGLLRVLRTTSRHFALIPTESDFRPALRDALFDHLRSDLSKIGLSLGIIKFTREQWDLTEHLDTEETKADVLVVIGLEETPGMVQEPGAPVRRPPALSVLNQLREAIRKEIAKPLILWCDPLSYTALQEHAPDFYDHYTALFTIMDVAPIPMTGDSFNDGLNEPGLDDQNWDISSPTAVAFYADQVEHLQQPTVERARVLIGLADALGSLKAPDVDPRLCCAQAAVEEALTLLSLQTTPLDWARGQLTLGNILSALATGNREQNLQRAITCYEATLCVYTEADFPRDWAGIQNNLGNAYWNLPIGDRTQNLLRAIACYEAALRVYTEAEYPIDWAATQNNLGNFYQNPLVGNRAQNLLQAITCYEAALRVRTQISFPVQWALTQNNLGTAYSSLPVGNRAQNLLQAITCYEAALRVRTKAEYPLDWAATQNNLGIAYSSLPVGDRAQNLQRAITCFEATLWVYTETDFTMQWAEIQRNLGIALKEQGKTEKARRAWEAAARGYRKVGLEEQAQQMENWIEALKTA